jgi:hypothetical protein
MDQLADEARLHKVMPPQIIRVSRGNLFIEQGRNGRLEASLRRISHIIIKTAVSQLALRPSQALVRLRQRIFSFIHTTVEFCQCGACTASVGNSSWDSITMRSSAKTPATPGDEPLSILQGAAQLLVPWSVPEIWWLLWRLVLALYRFVRL